MNGISMLLLFANKSVLSWFACYFVEFRGKCEETL